MKVKSDHELQVDAFIPEAERIANKAVPDWKSGKRDDWDRIFFAEMNRLTMAAGLRVPFKGGEK